MEDLLAKKEFKQYQVPPHGVQKDFRNVGVDEYEKQYLKPHVYQLTSGNYMAIGTHNKSLHLQHAPGAGKTLSAIIIAMGYIKTYKYLYAAEQAKLAAKKLNYANRQELDRLTPSVFVLGFSGPKAAFIRDLMNNPEFGFITIAEKIEMAKLAKQMQVGTEADVAAYNEFRSNIRRRIISKHRGGFFKFYGYEEFANRIFSTSSSTQLVALEVEAVRQYAKFLAGGPEPKTIYQLVEEAIAAGQLDVNTGFMAMLENSLIIADEIHNTYNVVSKNNRGVAIQYALEKVPSLRFVSMSATPVNTSPTEIVELINYHLAAGGDSRRADRHTLFTGRKLKPGALDTIADLFAGKLSFIQDINLKYFPARIDVGQPYILPKDCGQFRTGQSLPYLKFIECPMSELHQKTLTDYVAQREATAGEITNAGEDILEYIDFSEVESPYRYLPADGYTIFDMVFPTPDGTGTMFKSGQVRKTLMENTAATDLITAREARLKGDSILIGGEFLRRANIERYSTKAAKLLDILSDVIKSANGDPEKTQRVMIYHDRVATSGVLFYQELLLSNGYVDEYGEPTEDSMCMVCGKRLRDHGQECRFKPARFVIAHSMVEKKVMEESIVKYNHPDNIRGHSYMIIIGSRIIKESYDFKAVRHQIIMSLTTSMSMMLQINGRCIRKESHAGLPQEDWTVSIYILLSTVNPKWPSPDKLSPEVYRYASKLEDYIEIQKIEQRTNSVAFDGDIHRSITMPPEMLAKYFPDGKGSQPVASFGNLYFEPKYKVPDNTSLTTFRAQRHWETEVAVISYVIKKLFLAQPAWKYDQLWQTVRSPPINLEVNPQMFLEDNFIIALSGLVDGGLPAVPIDLRKGKTAADTAYQNHPATVVSRLLDPVEKLIYKDGQRMKITQVGEYYLLAPISVIETTPINTNFAEYVERIRNEEVQIMRNALEISNVPTPDIETYRRHIDTRPGIIVSVDSYLREAKVRLNHTATRETLLIKPTPERFVYDTSEEFQIFLLEDYIANYIFGKTEFDYAKFQNIINFLGSIKMLVTVGEIKKYKDVSRLFKSDIDALADDKIIGFSLKKSVKVYDPAGNWFEVNKISLNRQIQYKENSIVIGYIESVSGTTKFKLRIPIEQIKDRVQNLRSKKSHLTLVSAIGKDTRTIEKGMVCTTKNKKNLEEILTALGVNVKGNKEKISTVVAMCKALRRILLEKEIKQRIGGTREKWLYFWWDEQPSLI